MYVCMYSCVQQELGPAGNPGLRLGGALPFSSTASVQSCVLLHSLPTPTGLFLFHSSPTLSSVNNPSPPPQIWPQPHSLDMQSPLSHGSASCIEEAAAKSNSDQPRHTNLHPGVHPSACHGGPKRHMTPPQLSASGLRELLGWRPLAAYYAPPFVTTPPKEVLKPEKQPVLRRGCAVPPRPASHPTNFSIQRLKRKIEGLRHAARYRRLNSPQRKRKGSWSS